jgi:hypothetical protein
MEISTRMATAADVSFLARLMERSMLPAQGQGLFDELAAAIGMDRISFHEAVLLSGANNWGQLSDYAIAECDGELAAGTSAHLSSMPDIRPITLEQLRLLSEHLGLSAQESKDLLRAYIKKFGAFGDLPHLRHPAEYVLEYGGVMPPFEGRQVPGHLIGHHVERAIARGCKTLGIVTLVGNNLALASFLRYGLAHHSTVTADDVGHGFVGTHRLVLDLTNLPEGYQPGRPLPRVRRRAPDTADPA